MTEARFVLEIEMVELRITKYSPKHRDDSGAYLLNDWISASDIGDEFNGELLTAESYLEIEKQYVNSILLLMNAAGVSTLSAINIELHTDLNVELSLPDEITESTLRTVLSNEHLALSEVSLIIQAALRELLWCRLVGSNGFYVHFGYDYYMYAGFDNGSINQIQIPTLLFWEEFRSPDDYYPDGVWSAETSDRIIIPD